MTGTSVIERPAVGTGSAVEIEDLYQVVLWNDDHNTMEHVVECLMRVFAHPLQLAQKIMREAHEKGRAVAEVEAESLAILHRDQLQSMGLTATLEKI